MITMQTLHLEKKVLVASLTMVVLFSLVALMGAQNAYAADVLSRQLEVGSSGTDVRALQAFLAKDPAIYPEGLITGYYGPLTMAAVAKFQARNNISAVGRVGPLTLPVLNAQMSTGVIGGSSEAAPIISSVGVNVSTTSATIRWNTNEGSRGRVNYSTSPLVLMESNGNTGSLSVSGAPSATESTPLIAHSISLSNLTPRTRYYYLIYTVDADGNETVTWPTTFLTL